MKVSDKVYKDACYKDFVESGLAIAEYAENNRITVDFVNSIIKHGRGTVSLYSVHEAFKNMSKIAVFEIDEEIYYIQKSEFGFEAINDCFCKVSSVHFSDFDYCDKITDCLDLMLQELHSKLLTI